MKYEEIVEAYIKIENTSKRLEMTDHLVELILRTPPGLLDKVLYLTQGKLYPDFHGIELGIAEKLALKAITFGTGNKESEVDQAMLDLGDLGMVAEKMVASKKQMALFTEELDVKKTFDNFDKIAKASGNSSQDLKIKLVAELLHDSKPKEARYIIRTLIGKLRLGIADMTLLDALSYAFTPTYSDRLKRSEELIAKVHASASGIAGIDVLMEEIDELVKVVKTNHSKTTAALYESIERSEKLMKAIRKSKALPPDNVEELKSLSENVFNELKLLKTEIEDNRIKIENAYNMCSDLGEVARVLVRDGTKGLAQIQIKPGIPIRAMLAERLGSVGDIIEKLKGQCAFEYKYDGLRVQAHISDEVRLFSRRLEDITEQFPEVQKWLKESFNGKNAIVEGECVPVDPQTYELLPFQQISRRRGRKHEVKQAVDEFPVVLILFDVLYTDEVDYTSKSFPVRREKLTELFNESDNIKFSNILITSSDDEAERFFEESLLNGSEGLMAKSIQPDSFYRAGSRG